MDSATLTVSAALEWPAGASSAHRQSCPCCGARLIRIRRRFVDRVMSRICLVHRFRCTAFGCVWEGNRRPQYSTQAGELRYRGA